jgi:hypothetical protein
VVRTEGAEAGRTVADPGADRPPARWCHAVDSDRVRRVFLDVLAGADRRAGASRAEWR